MTKHARPEAFAFFSVHTGVHTCAGRMLYLVKVILCLLTRISWSWQHILHPEIMIPCVKNSKVLVNFENVVLRLHSNVLAKHTNHAKVKNCQCRKDKL